MITLMKRILFLTLISLSFNAIFLESAEPLILGQDAPNGIFMNNRILATVNQKAISVLDVMKKMDLLFYKQYPQYTSSIPARFQFYQMHWKNVLQEFVDKELVLADAEDLKMPLTNGEIRQEMETLFGPNIIHNLDKVGLTYQEAWKMVEEDIRLRRMIYYRANTQALRKITPSVIYQAYEEYAKKNIRPETWEYRVLTIRHPQTDMGAKAGEQALIWLAEKNHTLEEISKLLEGSKEYPDMKVTLSELLKHEEKDLNPSFKDELIKLNDKEFSKLVAQTSRKENSTVYRIFYLDKHSLSGAPAFHDVENEIRDELLSKACGEETDAYLKRLRAYYHVDERHFKEMATDDFSPFVLK